MDSSENTNAITYLVGKNAADNWRIYKESNLNDTIFHLEKFSSAYIIVNIPMDKMTTEQIANAANLCKSKTKYKNVPDIGVMLTPKSNTKLGNEVGSFIVLSNHKTKVIYV
jgi:hypothetical protein